VLLVLFTEGPGKMSSIAATLGIALPSATGVVDNLVRKRLVVRMADPQDRRLVICRLSPAGQQLINRLWVSGESQIERLLDGLTPPQLEKADDVARMLLENISRKTESGDAGK
jgi:DNA-binding MarR family transcriptional regulator